MWFAGIKFVFIAVCISLSLYYAHDLIKAGYNGCGWFIFIAFVLAIEMPSAERLYKTKKKCLTKKKKIARTILTKQQRRL